MALLGVALAGFVAVQHLLFLVLEMFFWNKPLGLKVFRRTQQQADDSFQLAKNQGLYNGFLTAGLAWGIAHPDPAVGFQVRLFNLGCVVVAGIFGAITVGPRLFFIQAVPAIVAIAVTLLGR
jgi:putative membrane protein